MSSVFSADVKDIIDRSAELAVAVHFTEQLVLFWSSSIAPYRDWPGIEGDGDYFADDVGPQIRKEYEQICATLETIGPGFLNLVDLVRRQADDIKGAQLDALDTIHGTMGHDL